MSSNRVRQNSQSSQVGTTIQYSHRRAIISQLTVCNCKQLGLLYVVRNAVGIAFYSKMYPNFKNKRDYDGTNAVPDRLKFKRAGMPTSGHSKRCVMLNDELQSHFHATCTKGFLGFDISYSLYMFGRCPELSYNGHTYS